jgi:carboxylesterase
MATPTAYPTCDSVSIGGLCLGSVLALRVAALRSDHVAAFLGLSTILYFDGWGNPWFTPFLPLARYVPFARRIAVAEKSPFGLKDERMRAWIQRQMKVAGASEAGAATLRVEDLLKSRELIAQTKDALQQISCPILLLHATEDECAKPRSSFEVALKVRSK